MEIKEMVVKARKAQEIYEHHFDRIRSTGLSAKLPVSFMIMPKNWPGWL